ncbi:MAG: hypothetical protein C4337_07545 [Armatimonadota bacterium]
MLFALLGAGLGGLWVWWRQRRETYMLQLYRKEHLRLRQIANQVRSNLQRMTGTRTTYPELDEILRKDAALRSQATRLRMTIEREARRGLSWLDHLAAASEALYEGLSGGGFRRIDWSWRAYRAKLERELNTLGRKLERNRDPFLENSLSRAYRQKARELASFQQLERTLHTLENECTTIATGLESLLVETIRLSTAPYSHAVSTDHLLEPLRQQIAAFEQALKEAYQPTPEEQVFLRE